MKKPLTMREEAQPRNVTRADLVLTEGFGLEVDGRMKTVFPTLLVAEKKARDLKEEFPMLQIKVYDAAEKTRTLVESPFRPSRRSQKVLIRHRLADLINTRKRQSSEPEPSTINENRCGLYARC